MVEKRKVQQFFGSPGKKTKFEIGFSLLLSVSVKNNYRCVHNKNNARPTERGRRRLSDADDRWTDSSGPELPLPCRPHGGGSVPPPVGKYARRHKNVAASGRMRIYAAAAAASGPQHPSAVRPLNETDDDHHCGSK